MQRSGLGYIWYGFELIFKPKLRRFVYIPLIINIILFIAIWYGAGHFFNELVLKIDGYMPEWLHWLNGLFWLIFGILGILFTVYIFTIIANLIGAPFYGLLSESVQLYLKNEPLPETKWADIIKDSGSAMARQWQMIKYYIPRALLLFIISFIPVINIVSGILWFLFSAWMQSVQYIDYPMDNNKKSFKVLRKMLGRHKGAAFSFGIPVLILMMIPIVNIVVMPAAVAGATAMWMDKLREEDGK